MSRFANIFEAFAIAVHKGAPDKSHLVLNPSVAIRYDEARTCYDVYQVVEDENVAVLNPAIEWNHNDMLWFFYDARDNQYAAHIEFLSEYQPKLRVGTHLAKIQRF